MQNEHNLNPIYLTNKLFDRYEPELRSLHLNTDDINLIKSRWNEPHRFYHNIYHLSYILEELKKAKSNFSIDEYFCLVIAAFFHDVVYDPSSFTNEEDSIDLMKSLIVLDEKRQTIISSIILATKSSIRPSRNTIEDHFWMIDNSVLFGSFQQLLEYERKIMLEFQEYPYEKYKKGRISFLQNWLKANGEWFVEDTEILTLINYVKQHRPKIAIYPGSFNPFHVGHLNILEKAEQIFDKVIIALGKNPSKEIEFNEAQFKDKSFAYREIYCFNGMLTSIIEEEEKHADVTLIRGLRNGDDLDYEVNSLRHMQKLKPDLKVAFISCDKEYEHISSSAIRSIQKIEGTEKEKLLNDYLPK